MDQVSILTAVVASPSDVQPERDALSRVAEELNRTVARAHGMRLEVVRWETDAYPGFHVDGPQGLIDTILRIEDSDIFIGIFWKRFGSPTMGVQSGTEHEFLRAVQAWRERGQPHIMFYFSQKPHTPASVDEISQWGRVLDFQRRFPAEGLWWRYKDELEFERFVREHLTMFILDQAKEENKGDDVEDDEGDDEEPEDIHDDDPTIEGGMNIPYLCELEEGDMIKIDLRTDVPLDIMIMDEESYQTWLRNGPLDAHRIYENRDQLHAFFTATEDGEYLVVLCNRLRHEADVFINISHAN